jgi:hypothetical protein
MINSPLLKENELLKDKLNNCEVELKKLRAEIQMYENVNSENKTLTKKCFELERENSTIKSEMVFNAKKLQRQMEDMREKYEKELSSYREINDTLNFKYNLIIKYGNDLKCLEIEKLELKDENLKLENLYRDSVIYEKIKYAKKVEEFCNQTAKSVLNSKKVILKRAMDQIKTENRVILLKNQEFADELEKQAKMIEKLEALIKEKDEQVQQMKIELETQKAIGKNMTHKNNTFIKLMKLKQEGEKDTLVPINKSLKSTFYESKSVSQVNLFSTLRNNDNNSHVSSSGVNEKLEEMLTILGKLNKLGCKDIILTTPVNYKRSNYDTDHGYLINLVKEIKREINKSTKSPRLKLGNGSYSRTSVLDNYENILSRNKNNCL